MVGLCEGEPAGQGGGGEELSLWPLRPPDTLDGPPGRWQPSPRRQATVPSMPEVMAIMEIG